MYSAIYSRCLTMSFVDSPVCTCSSGCPVTLWSQLRWPNEAYLKLMRTRGIRCEKRVHFLAICSQIIRRILLDHARNHGYAKRGGDAIRVPLDEALLGMRDRAIDMLALNQALESLSTTYARTSCVAEWRDFG